MIIKINFLTFSFFFSIFFVFDKLNNICYVKFFAILYIYILFVLNVVFYLMCYITRFLKMDLKQKIKN